MTLEEGRVFSFFTCLPASWDSATARSLDFHSHLLLIIEELDYRLWIINQFSSYIKITHKFCVSREPWLWQGFRLTFPHPLRKLFTHWVQRMTIFSSKTTFTLYSSPCSIYREAWLGIVTRLWPTSLGHCLSIHDKQCTHYIFWSNAVRVQIRGQHFVQVTQTRSASVSSCQHFETTGT